MLAWRKRELDPLPPESGLTLKRSSQNLTFALSDISVLSKFELGITCKKRNHLQKVTLSQYHTLSFSPTQYSERRQFTVVIESRRKPHIPNQGTRGWGTDIPAQQFYIPT